MERRSSKIQGKGGGGGISVCVVHFNASEESETNPGLSCMDASALFALKDCASGVQVCHGYSTETPK